MFRVLGIYNFGLPIKNMYEKTPQLSISNFTGVLSKIQKLRMEVDNGNLTYLDLTDSLDVYIIGGLHVL